MTYPAGVQLSTLTFNNPATYLGNPVTRTEITVQVNAGVVWAATGDPIRDVFDAVALGPGVPGAVTFPAVDQPGFTDFMGRTTTLWSYVVKRTMFFGSASVGVQKSWQPLTGQAAVDFDTLPGGGGGPAFPPAFPVSSVAGETGVVEAESLAGALVPFMPPPDLSGVPPLVAASLASDPTVANSAATMAQSTAGLVPVWKANESVTAGQRRIAPNGDIVSAKSTFTTGAVYAAANWNPSSQDGRLGTLEKTAVFNGDARLLDASSDVEGILAAVVDQNDRRTALEIGLNGDFTTYATGRIGKSLGIEDLALDSGQGFVVVDASDRILFSDTSTPASSTSALPAADWAHWGDSLTDNLVTGANAWVTQLSVLTGRNHYNGGWYSQKHDNIAARQGGLPALVTLPGNVTAASGATTVSAIINKPVLQSTSRTVRGTLAGVLGTLQEAVTDTVTFTPDTPGAYTVPAKSVFTPADGATYRDRTVTIWSGRNSIYDTDPQIIVSAIRAMIDYLTPNVKRVIVMEIPPFTTDSSTTRNLTAAINTAIKAAFPAHWLPIATWLRTAEAATAAGITFTAQDNTDIANGDTPASFRSDNGHLNATGCKAVAYRVYQEAQKRGWL